MRGGRRLSKEVVDGGLRAGGGRGLGARTLRRRSGCWRLGAGTAVNLGYLSGRRLTLDLD